MLELILVLTGVAGLFFVAQRQSAAKQAAQQPGERGGDVLSLLSFEPFQLVAGQPATVQVLARSQLPPQVFGQLAALQWGLNPRTTPVVIRAGLPIPGAISGSADLWLVDAVPSQSTTVNADTALARILTRGLPAGAQPSLPGGTASSPRSLAAALLLSSQSPSFQDAITVPVRRVR